MARSKRLFVSAWLLFLLGLGAAACQRIDAPPSVVRGELEFEDRVFPDAIPAAYGDLAGVIPGEGGWAAFVFQKPDDTIVIIGVNRFGGRIDDRVVVIPRR